jgi:hypothetical protein
MWLWTENGAWHGPTDMPPDRWHSMTAMHAAINGYKLAQGFTAPAPKPAEPDELLPEDQEQRVLPEDQEQRVLHWLWKGGRKARWWWEPKTRIWSKHGEFGEFGAVTMTPADAWGQGFLLFMPRQQPPEATCQDGTPPCAPLYRMRAEGATLDGYIKVRRERVLAMRKAADEQARLVREQLDRADMLETELDCLEASMVRADPENTP